MGLGFSSNCCEALCARSGHLSTTFISETTSARKVVEVSLKTSRRNELKPIYMIHISGAVSYIGEI